MTPHRIITRFLSLPPRGIDPSARLRIEEGTIADYDALAPHHYRAGRPATWVKVLRVVDPECAGVEVSRCQGVKGRTSATRALDTSTPGYLDTSRLAAVLVISMPTLNGAWRKLAWPEGERSTDRANGEDRANPESAQSARFAPPASPREAARHLNTHLRCISRLVVHPSWRGLGLATRLVRAYLDNPLTPRTEALTAMGDFCPVFASAGMREVPIPPTAADARLAAVLSRARIAPASLPDRAHIAPAIARALRSWAWQWKGARAALKRNDLTQLARLAAARLTTPRTAWIADSMPGAALTPGATACPAAPPPAPPSPPTAGKPCEPSSASARPDASSSLRLSVSSSLPENPSPPHLHPFPHTPPLTPDDLHRWITDHLGVNIPRVPMITDHQAPFDYITHVFFEGGTQQGPWLQASWNEWRAHEQEHNPQPDAPVAPRTDPPAPIRHRTEPRTRTAERRVTRRSSPSSPAHLLTCSPAHPPPPLFAPTTPPPPTTAPADSILWANRGGGKTFLGAIATALDMIFKPGIEIRILAGSLEQAQRMHRYLRRFFERPALTHLIHELSARRLRLTNHSAVEILAQSETSVRGNRVQRIRCDEVELFAPEVWEAAQLTTQSKQCGPFYVRGSLECLSTLHLPHGLMSRLVKEAREGRRSLFRWSLLDSLERCPDEHHCRADGTNASHAAERRADVARGAASPGDASPWMPSSSDHPAPEGRANQAEGTVACDTASQASSDPPPDSPEEQRRVTPPSPAGGGEVAPATEVGAPSPRSFSSCSTGQPAHFPCGPPATPVSSTLPSGDLPPAISSPAPSPAHLLTCSPAQSTYPVDSLPPPPSIPLPVLTRKACPLLPECQGRAKHTQSPGHITIADAIRMKSRVTPLTWQAEMLCQRAARTFSVYPDFDPAIHVTHHDPSTPGHLDTLTLSPATLVAGMDFGYRTPTVILWATLDDRGTLIILHERVETEVIVEVHARAIADGPHPRPAWVAIDPAGNSRSGQTGISAREVLRRAGLTVKSRSLDLHEGLDLVRARLKPIPTHNPIAPPNRDLIASGGVTHDLGGVTTHDPGGVPTHHLGGVTTHDSTALAAPPRLLIHARCTHLIEALETYHHNEKNPSDPDPVKDGPDHAADALRYLVVNLDRPAPTGHFNYLYR